MFEFEVKSKRTTKPQNYDLKVVGSKITLSKKLVEILENKSLSFGKPVGETRYAFVIMDANEGTFYTKSKRGDKKTNSFSAPRVAEIIGEGEFTLSHEGIYYFPVNNSAAYEAMMETHEADNVTLNQQQVYNTVEGNIFNN